jgi:hypothetical protein
MAHRTFLSPLTNAEKQQLRKQQFKDVKGMTLVFGLMFFGVLALAPKIPTNILIFLLTLIAIVVVSIAFMILLIFGSSPLFKKDIDSNSKTVIQGVLENKLQEEVNASGSVGNLGNHYYYFLIGETKIRVSWRHYYAFSVGDSIEISVATHSNYVLGIDRKSPEPAPDYSYRVLIEVLTSTEKLGMIGKTIFGCFIGSAFVLTFGYISYRAFPDYWMIFIPTGLLGTGVVVLILGFLYKTTSTIIIGKKEVVEGTLRGKEWIGGTRGNHYFILGGKKFEVGNMRFNTPQVGETIRIVRLKDGEVIDWDFA